jgi:hypothetical protein
VSQRDRDICALRVEGHTLASIGVRVGITTQAVRQILKKVGGPTRQEVDEIRTQHQRAIRLRIRRGIREDMEMHPGNTIQQIAARLDVSEMDIRANIPDHLRRLILQAVKTYVPKWSDEAIRRTLVTAATYEFPLTNSGYERLVAQGEVVGPSGALVIQRFGTWSAACSIAGVESAQAVRDNYQSTWTDDDLYDFVVQYLSSPGTSGTFSKYDEWRQETNLDAPSGPTIRNRLGAWGVVKPKALKLLAEKGGSFSMIGTEAKRLDAELASMIDEGTRSRIWSSVNSLLERGPLCPDGSSGATALALGFIQSGKTTSITALLASAADQGYRVIIAFLGATNLLLDQNRQRMEHSLGIDSRQDYVWVSETNPSGTPGARRLATHIERERVVLVPVLKHSKRIRSLTKALEGLGADVPVLIIDDEADQASLNTAGLNAESSTYEAIQLLRKAVPNHLYVQYTATPYAPLLLDAEDLLRPEFVEFLQPGPGYTGGREFFVDFAERVVRDVPALEEQGTKTPPLSLPTSLVSALASFVAGASLLLLRDPSGSPVSMLVHSTARNDVQARYHFLLNRQLLAWKRSCETATSFEEMPRPIVDEHARLVSNGVKDSEPEDVLKKVRFVLREANLWLVNKTSEVNKVDWNVSPIHILVGGNKLDRGFTVEGLTVTYMNRPASTQVDTLEQRARAFGYRRDQLPFCQFFASKRTVRSLRDIVYTEYDLRGQLQDHINSGGSVRSWAREVGLLLPEGMKPTRDAVVQALSSTPFGWHSLRRPVLDPSSIAHNRELVNGIGLLQASRVDYGRLSHRTTYLSIARLRDELLIPWSVESYSPSWRHTDILQALARRQNQAAEVPVLLMEDGAQARTRKWDEAVGFINLFQGRDLAPGPDGVFYPGDRAIPNIEQRPDDVVVQIHRVKRRDNAQESELLTIALYLGTRSIVRKLST